MLAILAAILFGIGLLIDLFNLATNDVFNFNVLMFAGLLCVALHLAGVGTTWRSRSGGWYRRRSRSRV